MFASAFAGLVYVAPALAGFFIWTVKRITSVKWAVMCYFVSSAVIFLTTAQLDAALMFVGFLGYYPLIAEPLSNRKVIGYIGKLAVFNAAVIGIFQITTFVTGIDAIKADMFLGKYTAIAVLALGNATFIMYDKAARVVFLFFDALILPKLRHN
jgi:hypothetical protein